MVNLKNFSEVIHPSWKSILETALTQINAEYLQKLLHHQDWLPNKNNLLNAFSLPKEKTRYILFGESPYPRVHSANGYAFWDGAVHSIWSEKGFSSQVNRATSLRNILKMLLLAGGDLKLPNFSQLDIAKLDKSKYVQTLDELFQKLLRKGFLLLNASLVFHSEKMIKEDAKQWLPFINTFLEKLKGENIQLVLLGKIAHVIRNLPSARAFPQFAAEHPYNLSFITSPEVQNFFRPLNLLVTEQFLD